ncbi:MULTISPECIES: hypothetical protein [Sphingomonas]|uniref:5-bromo-4-chloroindolyl phosphate hydrolysis protein n=1 Tax=Sphingomonas pseudosanguinis TaxID=413712 RepID=A0A7W6F405_9SPHN|nr:hypothetical protein [Sphingomonas sp.]MBB3880363.1 hypothetical protein [Sphingomonas pseudosanguinis]
MTTPRSNEVDAQIERAREVMARISQDYRGSAQGAVKRVRRQARSVMRRVILIAIANAAILIAAMVTGLILPGGIGIFGALAAMLLMLAVTLMIALAPAPRAPSPAKLAQVDIKALPGQTERWLEAQRPRLPAPAVTLVDRIGQRLETLSPQLAAVDNDTVEAMEVRRLIGEQLPAFLRDYERVPEPLRRVERNGRTPDAQLVDGLKLIEQEIGDMTQRLAQADLDSLSTRGRYLEMKYREEKTE